MAENSKIEWCDHTFNPWMGCTKVSSGCKHCYAETMMDKRWKKVQWGPQGVRVKTSTEMWRKPFTWNAKHVNGMPRQRVFCASLADVFEDNPQLVVWRSMLFLMIEMTSNLDWLLLTKRPENIMQMVPPRWADRFPQNIWLGTSVENQKAADERIGHLVRAPAVVKFLSCEPLLEKVDLDLRGRNYGIGNEYVNWVICGGESGKGARPMHPTWVKSIRDQCVRNDVPFFFKQWGEYLPVGGPEHYAFEELGKKRAGRVLDGRTWDGIPVLAPLSASQTSPQMEERNLGGGEGSDE